MIDHIGMPVRDLARATEFYLKALAPLGIGIVMQVSAEDSRAMAPRSASAPTESRSSGSAKASGSAAAMCMSPSPPHRARRSMPSIAPASPPAARTMARRASGRITTPIITPPSCSIPTATISRRSATPSSLEQRSPGATSAAHVGQGELAGGHALLALLLLLFRILLGLPVIGAVHVLVREVHPDELAVFEHEARRAGPVRVLLLLAVFAEDGGQLVIVGLLALVGFLARGRLPAAPS